MSTRSIRPGFHPVRHDRPLLELVHDAYKSKGKLPDPTVVRHAYQGELEFHYNPEENLLRVHWKH